MATRLTTAAIGLTVGVITLFLADTIVFNLAIGLISAVIVFELLQAEKCLEHKVACGACVAYGFGMAIMTIPELIKFRYLFCVLCIMVLFVIFIIQHNCFNFTSLTFMITVSALVSAAMCCLLMVHQLDSTHGVFYICFVLAAAWVADAGAYFVGTFFGKHKLCPDISPKKTIEGAVGGVVTNIAVLCLGSWGYSVFMASRGINFSVYYVLIIVIGLISSVLAILGDLVGSLIKRQCKIKDFGNIMPGHGGMMDRFDSVLFVAPFLAMVFSSMRIFY